MTRLSARRFFYRGIPLQSLLSISAKGPHRFNNMSHLIFLNRGFGDLGLGSIGIKATRWT